MKPFYIHINPYKPGPIRGRKPRGATILVSESDKAHEVVMRVALCSKRDSFCKATGRAEAGKAEAHTMNKREVPFYIGMVAMLVDGLDPKTAKQDVLQRRGHRYDYVLKNFL